MMEEVEHPEGVSVQEEKAPSTEVNSNSNHADNNHTSCEAEATAKIATEAEATAKIATEAEATAKITTEAEATAKTVTEAEATAEIATEAEATEKVATEAEATGKIATEAEAMAEIALEAEPTAKIATEAEAMAEIALEAEPTAKIDMEAEATAEVTMETGENTDVPDTPEIQGSDTLVVQGNSKNPASEKLQRVRKWSINTYKYTRQALSERLGRGSRTVDLDLEARLDLLKDDRQRYDNVTKLTQTMANQLAQLTVTQKTLGDTFSELGVKTPMLNTEFGMNAEAHRFLSKSGETLTTAINSFTSDLNTLLNKTIEDTMINAKQYEAIRIEYDAYRVDLEELNLKPRDATTFPKLEQAQVEFQGQKEKYQKVRDDLSVKLKLLEENKVKVLHNQLWLLHNAIASHSSSCHSFLEKNIQKASEHLNNPSMDAPSWLEEC
ncbi:arfaptin-1-like [Scomber scombrus]|uniref:arfaptin-1-like n=1 Tax=Scomber scombrus TaxID=13677 RepID=UPI002DDB8E8B|nr:arfaptin-1-like [Scomber scombrus]